MFNPCRSLWPMFRIFIFMLRAGGWPAQIMFGKVMIAVKRKHCEVGRIELIIYAGRFARVLRE